MFRAGGPHAARVTLRGGWAGHEWTVWRRGRHLFHLMVCDDASAAMSALADESADPDRDLQIGPFVELFLDGAPGFAPLHGVPDLAHRGPAAP